MPEDTESVEPLAQLHQATITIDHRSIRIEGKEDKYKRMERHTYRQVSLVQACIATTSATPTGRAAAR